MMPFLRSFGDPYRFNYKYSAPPELRSPQLLAEHFWRLICEFLPFESHGRDARATRELFPGPGH
jgi:hypothetical protein